MNISADRITANRRGAATTANVKMRQAAPCTVRRSRSFGDSTCWSTMGLKWILCGRYSTEFAASAGKQAADGQIIFVKEGKLWIKGAKNPCRVYLCCLCYCRLLSLFFIAKEAHHDCTGEDCPVCACIHRAEQTLKQIGTGSSETAGAFAPSVSAGCGISFAFLCLRLSFPFISQKVRMNN